MHTPVSPLWFSDKGGEFRGTEPYYFDTHTIPWVGVVESKWEVIRDELRSFVASNRNRLEPYMNAEMSSRPNKWRTLGLMFWTLRVQENCRNFPKTLDILGAVPGLIAVSFNLLEGGTTIKPHYGNTNAIYRCHLGIEIPARAPQCAFRVGNDIRSWEEGKLLVFCDAHEHTAWNNTQKDRYVLVMDVIRPEFARRKLSISSRVLSGIYLETAQQRSPWIRRATGSPLLNAVAFAGFRMFFLGRLFANALSDRRSS
jgi:aspartyl/asparaginyl beta-hydroxylase (cupin superfamily)